MSSTLEKIQANEAAVGQLANSNVEISRRIMALDQAQLSISKTLAAVSEVLIDGESAEAGLARRGVAGAKLIRSKARKFKAKKGSAKDEEGSAAEA